MAILKVPEIDAQTAALLGGTPATVAETLSTAVVLEGPGAILPKSAISGLANFVGRKNLLKASELALALGIKSPAATLLGAAAVVGTVGTIAAYVAVWGSANFIKFIFEEALQTASFAFTPAVQAGNVAAAANALATYKNILEKTRAWYAIANIIDPLTRAAWDSYVAAADAWVLTAEATLGKLRASQKAKAEAAAKTYELNPVGVPDVPGWTDPPVATSYSSVAEWKLYLADWKNSMKADVSDWYNDAVSTAKLKRQQNQDDIRASAAGFTGKTPVNVVAAIAAERRALTNDINNLRKVKAQLNATIAKGYIEQIAAATLLKSQAKAAAKAAQKQIQAAPQNVSSQQAQASAQTTTEQLWATAMKATGNVMDGDLRLVKSQMDAGYFLDALQILKQWFTVKGV